MWNLLCGCFREINLITREGTHRGLFTVITAASAGLGGARCAGACMSGTSLVLHMHLAVV